MSFNPAWEPDSKLDKASVRQAGPGNKKPNQKKETSKQSLSKNSVPKTIPEKASSSRHGSKQDVGRPSDLSKRLPLPLVPKSPSKKKVTPAPTTNVPLSRRLADHFARVDLAVYAALSDAADARANPKTTYAQQKQCDAFVVMTMVAAVEARIVFAPQEGFNLNALPHTLVPEWDDDANRAEVVTNQSPRILSKATKSPIPNLRRSPAKANLRAQASSRISPASANAAVKLISRQIAARTVPAGAESSSSDKRSGKRARESSSSPSSRSELVQKPNWPPGQNKQFLNVRAGESNVKGLTGGARYLAVEKKSASAATSSVTSKGSYDRTSLTSAGRNVNHRRRSSWPEVDYEYTQPESNPGGGVVRYGDAKVKVDPAFQDSIVQPLRAAQVTGNGVLMLLERQGCTFGYGSRFKVENGIEVDVGNADDVKRGAAAYKTRHISYYGANTEYISTTGCFTCLGVYFAIAGNRVFCAHLNVWHQKDRGSSGGRLKPVTLLASPQLYMEARIVTRQKMRAHMDEYGWKPADVKLDTVKFVSADRDWIAHVVAVGVLDAIGGNTRDFTVEDVDKGHGFTIVPGEDEYKDCFRLLEYRTYFGNIKKVEFHPFPLKYDRHIYTDDDNVRRGDWFCTVGARRWAQWELKLCNRLYMCGYLREIKDA